MATRLITTTTQHGSATARPGALARPPSEEAPETDTTAGISLTDAVNLALAHWSSSGAWSDLSVDKMGHTVRRWARRTQALGISHLAAVSPEHASGFVDAPSSTGVLPELSTRHARRSALRCFFATCRDLGLGDDDPARYLRLPRRSSLAARPLTDEEVALARTTAGALGGLRAVAWAIGESGAGSREIPQVRLADLDCMTTPTTMRLPGTRWIRPRTAPLTPWAQHVMASRAADLLDAGAGPERLLAYNGSKSTAGQQRQASICNSLRTVLHRSGLRHDSDVRPSSLRHWTGRRLYDTGIPLEQVADRMGYRSLDACAEDLALAWQDLQQEAPTP